MDQWNLSSCFFRFSLSSLLCRHRASHKAIKWIDIRSDKLSLRSCAHTIQPCRPCMFWIDAVLGLRRMWYTVIHAHKRPHIDSLNATHVEGGNWHIKWTHCKCVRHRRKIRWEAANQRAVCLRRAARINVNTEQNAITPTTATKYIARIAKSPNQHRHRHHLIRTSATQAKHKPAPDQI